MLVAFGVLTLWYPTRAFARCLKEDMDKTKVENYWVKQDRKAKWVEILHQYKLLREVAALINSAVGSLLTLTLCGSILTYGLRLDQIFTEFENPSWRNIIIYGFTTAVDVLVYCLGAQLCENVGSPGKEILMKLTIH